MHGSVQLRLRELDHPPKLGISGIGCDIVSVEVHEVKTCTGRLSVLPLVDACAMARGPDTSPEIMGREVGARTCLHVRSGRLTILECRFNKQRGR